MRMDGKRAYELQLAASDKGLDQLTATSLSADEGLSRPYSVRIRVHSLIPGDPGSFDPGSWLRKKVGVSLARDADPTWFHGLVVAVDHVGTDQDHRQIFSLELAPALSLLQLTRRTRVFLDMKPLDVVKSVLSEGSVAVDLKATGAGGVMRHITQFEESDFAFVSRLLEQEGACYWFLHTKSAHTMVIGDAASHHPGKDAAIHGTFVGAPKAGPESEGVVTELSHRFEIASKEAFVRDYSEGHPKQTAMGQKSAPTLPGIGGKHHEADYHVTMNDADATAYAGRLAEALVGRTSRLVGVSGILAYRAGTRMAVAGKEDYAEHLLLTEVQHTFGDDSYRNTFQAVPVGRLPWRPLRSTPIPRIDGLVPAIVTSTAGDQGQGIDGSYKVQLLNSDDAAERVVRMAQPYTGPGQGIHFPLPVNTEVMLSHAYGHPDRPIIAGAMHNGEDASQILDKNKTQCVVRSASGSSMVFEDEKGSESITLTSVKEHVLCFSDKDDLVSLHVEGDYKVDVKATESRTIGTDKSEKIGGESSLEVSKTSSTKIKGDTTVSIGGTYTGDVAGTAEVSVTKDTTLTLSGMLDVTVTKSMTLSCDGTGMWSSKKDLSLDTDAKFSLSSAKSSSWKADGITVDSKGDVVIKAGEASITMKKSGEIVIKGSKIKIEGSGDVVVKGSKTAVN